MVEDEGEQLLLVDIKPRSHEATAFVVDGFNNVVGMAYVKPGESLPTNGNFIFEQTTNALRIRPRSKFWIPVHKPQDCDPRGISHLRSIYTPWWKKQQLTPQHLAFVARFAQPSLVAKLSKEAKDQIPVYNSQNEIVSRKSTVTATTQALAKVKGGAVAAFIDTDVMMLEAKTEGKVIFDSYDHEDRQIAKGILWQTLTTEESQHMARAAGATHQDVFGIGIQFLRDLMEWSERHEILYWLVYYNYGEEAARRYTPVVSYGDVQVQDIPKTMAALAQLSLAGGIDPSMWPEIRIMLGLPPADPAQEQANLELTRQSKEAQAQRLRDGINNPAAGSDSAGNNSEANDNPPSPNPNRRANQ